jgi:hypothetical protein
VSSAEPRHGAEARARWGSSSPALCTPQPQFATIQPQRRAQCESHAGLGLGLGRGAFVVYGVHGGLWLVPSSWPMSDELVIWWLMNYMPHAHVPHGLSPISTKYAHPESREPSSRAAERDIVSNFANSNRCWLGHCLSGSAAADMQDAAVGRNVRCPTVHRKLHSTHAHQLPIPIMLMRDWHPNIFTTAVFLTSPRWLRSKRWHPRQPIEAQGMGINQREIVRKMVG